MAQPCLSDPGLYPAAAAHSQHDTILTPNGKRNTDGVAAGPDDVGRLADTGRPGNRPGYRQPYFHRHSGRQAPARAARPRPSHWPVARLDHATGPAVGHLVAIPADATAVLAGCNGFLGPRPDPDR